MEDFKDLQKFHGDCGRRVLVPNIPMEVSKSIWRHLSFCFRNVREVSVEKTWEHNPRWLKRGAEEHPKSICHWKQQVPSWLLWHMYPHQKPFQHWMVFITWSAAFTSGPQPHIGGTEIQTVWTADTTELQCLSKKQISTNHQDKSPETKKALQDKEKVWWNEETCRRQGRCKTMVGDMLPATDLQNRIPKYHCNC